ncbi:MAG: hypothetical protein WC962_08295 [Phycisphaerae bacterium]
MSPLTKILIVLLTFASVVLCAFVVSYVASADNYRGEAENYKLELQQTSQQTQTANKQLEQAKAQFEQREQQLQKQLADIKNQSTNTETEFTRQKAEVARLLDEANKWTALAESFKQAEQEQRQLLQNAQAELDKARSESVRLKKELDETSVALLERDAVVENLQGKVKALEEQNYELQSRLNQPLKALGQQATMPAPVTVPKGAPAPRSAVPSTQPVTNINIKGLVTGIDIKNSMASVSVGMADGVSKGMRFHVIRGDDFICDVLITNVDTDRSVGVLELVQQTPMVGDTVSTNF